MYTHEILWNNGENQWHNRLLVTAFENSIMANSLSIMWKSLLASHERACVEYR